MTVMARDEITHKGRIVEVGPAVTTVSIVSESACAACHASALCSISGMKEKKIEVPTVPGGDFKAGDEVDVMLAASMGMKAVVISYVFPLIVLLALVLALPHAGLGEVATGLCAIAGAALYYFGVWLFRDRLSGGYVFYIRKRQG